MSLTTDGVPPDLVRPTFAPGTVIADRYRIEARLGAGGGGTVFRCVDQRLNAVVALKVVASDADLERLRREVAMARQITDRNVCRVHDLGETAELRFVTMELVDGASLRSKIRPDLPAHEARALIEQLVSGVAAIHAAGVVHRDLKPENVVVAPDGRAVIVDFGLAKTPTNVLATLRGGTEPSPAVTHAGFAVGTPRYMSPEQAAGDPVDARTDVWSLGLVAHELLSGEMPEAGDDGPVVAPIVEQRWPGFAAVLGGCLALDPESRFTNASTLRTAIAQGGYTPPPSGSPTLPHGSNASTNAPTFQSRPNVPAMPGSAAPTMQSRPSVPATPEPAIALTMQSRPIHARQRDASNAPVNAPTPTAATPHAQTPHAPTPNAPTPNAPAPHAATPHAPTPNPANAPMHSLAAPHTPHAQHMPPAPPNPAASPFGAYVQPTPTNARRRARWPLVVAAIGASAVIGFVIVRATRGGSNPGSGSSGSGDTESPPGPQLPDTSTKMTKLTTTTDAQWPEQSPTSVAIDPTGAKLAYTTGGGKVYVRELSGGAPVEWTATVGVRDKQKPLATPHVAGWFDDGSLAIVGTYVGGTTGTVHAIRLRADGTSESLFESTNRVFVAVSPGNKVAIAQTTAILVDSKQVAEVQTGDRAVALAWSSDGALAWMRITPGGEAVLEIVGTGEIWRGKTELLIRPLLTFVKSRIAFSFRDRGKTTIALIDPATRKLAVVEELAGHVGSGNAVGGTLVVVRGPVREAVQLRDRFGIRTVLGHAADARGTHVAGWTTKGAAVYRVDDRVVSGQWTGTKTTSWQVETWPGTQPADVPTAVLGDDVIVRRDDGDAWIVERVTGGGTRTRIGRFEHAAGLRCSATDCVLQRRDGEFTTWLELDPTTGTLGKELYSRRTGTTTPSFALARDPRMAIATESDTPTVFDRATTQRPAPSPAYIKTHWRSVAFDDAGDLWATAIGLDAHPFGLVRFRKDGEKFGRPHHMMKSADGLRWFVEPSTHGAGDDLRIAVATKELRLELWRADGL